MKAAHEEDIDMLSRTYARLSENDEKSINEKDALIAELEEEVQLAVADQDAMVEEAHQAIFERDLLIDRCR